jgi:hypothetical protein
MKLEAVNFPNCSLIPQAVKLESIELIKKRRETAQHKDALKLTSRTRSMSPKR